MVLIETLGTNTDQPVALNPRLQKFYKLLVQQYRFHQEVLRTDYRFATEEEAERIVGFFFGEPMKEQLNKEPRTIVPEWTGV